MPTVRLSRRAQADFDEIVDYLTWNAEAGVAPRYGRAIRATINRLAEFPYIGSPRPVLGQNVRAAGVAPYLILYDSDSERGVVLVLRIIHASHDITRRMIEGGRE